MPQRDGNLQYYISIIIPAFNEAGRIERALVPAINYLKQKDFKGEIIVVDDGSMDSTKSVVQSHSGDFESLKIIDYSPNKGKGFAVKTGMLAAKGEFRLFMDADYAVPIEFVDSFLDNTKGGFDIVIGSREHAESEIISRQNFVRERMAKLFNIFQRLVLRLPFKDSQCGFKLFTAKAAENLFQSIHLDCALFDAELLYLAYNNGYKIKEMGVKWTHDNQTRLPIGFGRAVDLVTKLFRIRFWGWKRAGLQRS